MINVSNRAWDPANGIPPWNQSTGTTPVQTQVRHPTTTTKVPVQVTQQHIRVPVQGALAAAFG